jgi:hypothetical protein
MSAGTGSLDEPDDTGSQHGPRIRRRPARSDNSTAPGALSEPAKKSDHGTDYLGSHVRQIAEYALVGS